MNDHQFDAMDERFMKATAALREKKISEGMLKGFAASVERRLTNKKNTQLHPIQIFQRAWVPSLVVILIFGSLAVLRGPSQGVEYAELSATASDISAEIATLRELGVWDESDDSLLGTKDELDAQILEVSSNNINQSTSNIA